MRLIFKMKPKQTGTCKRLMVTEMASKKLMVLLWQPEAAGECSCYLHIADGSCSNSYGYLLPRDWKAILQNDLI